MESSGPFSQKELVVVGIGLMGGSILKALKTDPERPKTVIAYDIDEAVLKQVREADLADIATTSAKEALTDADFIVIALYPRRAIEFVRQNAKFLKSGAVVTDICGVKREIEQSIPALLPEGVRFVGGHPMAGREHKGFDCSVPDLFLGCKYIITNGDESAVAQVKAFADILGAGTIVSSSSDNHDEMIAYTSQLPHVLSVAYMLAADERGVEDFSAGSFRDLTRVAMINDEMWSELFLENKDKLLNEIKTLRQGLAEFESLLSDEDREKMREKMRKAAAMRERISG
ncbi:MAG: prephenate dehydrogenase [Eubacteriales bacterium]